MTNSFLSTLEKFTTFGIYFDISAAVQASPAGIISCCGYSISQISRLEQNLRLPDSHHRGTFHFAFVFRR